MSLNTLSTFPLFPNLPTELRLPIWDYAATALTGGPRVVELLWQVPLPSRQTNRCEDGARLLLVCKESSEQYLRTYRFIPKLQHLGQKEFYEDYFTNPQYIDPKLDTLFVGHSFTEDNMYLLDAIAALDWCRELRFLACRVDSAEMVYTSTNMARFSAVERITLTRTEVPNSIHNREHNAAFVSPSLAPRNRREAEAELEIQDLLQRLEDMRVEAGQTLRPFEMKDVLRDDVRADTRDRDAWFRVKY